MPVEKNRPGDLILVPAAPSKRYQPFGPLSQTVFICCRLPFCLSQSDYGNFDILKKCENIKIYERRNEKELKTDRINTKKQKQNKKTEKRSLEVKCWPYPQYLLENLLFSTLRLCNSMV